jgi:hypothetical protein
MATKDMTKWTFQHHFLKNIQRRICKRLSNKIIHYETRLLTCDNCPYNHLSNQTAFVNDFIERRLSLLILFFIFSYRSTASVVEG